MRKKTLREQVCSLSSVLDIFNEAVEKGWYTLKTEDYGPQGATFVDMRIADHGNNKGTLFFGISTFDHPAPRREITKEFGIDMPLDYVWPQHEKGRRSYVVIELQETFNKEAFLNGDIKCVLRAGSIDNLQLDPHRLGLRLGEIADQWKKYRATLEL